MSALVPPTEPTYGVKRLWRSGDRDLSIWEVVELLESMKPDERITLEAAGYVRLSK